MCAIVLHSNAPEILPRILSTRKDLVKGHLSKMFDYLMDELSSDSQHNPRPVVFLRYFLKLCFLTQKPGAHDASLFIEAASLR